jgi:hypothetical protein
MEKTNKQNGFPSDMVPMKVKSQKDWILRYSKEFYRTGVAIVRPETYQRFRKLAEGKQDIDQYKKILAGRSQTGKAKVSWRNLNYAILPIIPKFIKILKNKVLDAPKELKISAIDPYSISQQQKRKNDIIAFMALGDLNQEAQGAGVPVDSPFEEGEAIPRTINEVDLYMQAYPKNKHVVELYDELELCFTVNKWKGSIRRDLVDSLVKQGVLGTWPYLDSKGYIKIDAIRADRTITNPVEKNDFSDMTRIGEFRYLSVGEIREMASEEIRRGEITEKMLVDVVNAVNKKNYTPMTRDAIYGYAKEGGYGYEAPYDSEKVKVLRWQGKSTDTLAYVLNKDGEKIYLEKRDNPFWLDKNGYTDESFAEFNAQQGKSKSVVRCEIENIYQGWWVVDTDVVFSYGLKSDIQRNLNSLAKAEFDAKIFTTDFSSVVEDLETAAHNAQVNWLQFQHHSAMSIPDGVAINKRALTEITVGGKGGVTLDSLDLIDMYIQTGRMIYKDMDGNSKPIDKPFEFLKGTDPNRALHHLSMVFQSIDLIRAILGLNEVTDASTPNPELGKAVSEMAAMNSNTALGDFHAAYSYIYEETAKSIARLVPMARKKKNKGYVEALGTESQMYWQSNTMDFLDFSIKIDVGWDEDKHQSLRAAAQANLKSAGGTLKPQDVYIIENEKNPEKAYLILESKDKQRSEEEMKKSMALQEQNAKVQSDAAVQAEKAKQETLRMAEEFKVLEHNRQLEVLTHETELKIYAMKIEKGIDLTSEEQARLTQLIMSREKNATTLAAARISASSKPAQKKSA